MAIVQISKIIHRTGANIDLPQLDTGEIGFATDERKVYIGNDPILHPVETGNISTQTEILTEVSEINKLTNAGTVSSPISGMSNVTFDLNSVKSGQPLMISSNTIVNWEGNLIGSNVKLALGSPSNIKISGGFNGAVLQTDGTGNLAWTTSGVLTVLVANVSKADPAVVTTRDYHYFTTGTFVTLNNVDGMTQLATAGIDSTNKFYVYRLTDTTFSLWKDASVITGSVNSLSFTNALANTGRASSTLTIAPGYGGQPGGSNTQLQFNDAGAMFAGSPNLVFNKISKVLTLSGNLSTTNADLGNIATANYFTGTLTTASQPNITSVGNLTSLAVTGNVTSGNANLGNNASANYFVGNGSALSSITGANVTGQVSNASVASTVYTNAQPNITSVGNLTSLAVTGNVTSGNASLGNNASANYFVGNGSILSSITGANVTGQVANTLLAGTVYTNAQPNITSVGNLTTLTVTGATDLGNVGNVKITGGSANFVLKTDGAGNISWTTPFNTPAGNDTEIQFNQNGNLHASSNLTFNLSSKTLTVDNIAASGVMLSNISGANVTGQVANALLAGTVYTNAQPNITSIGTLTRLTVAGNITTSNASVGNMTVDNIITSGNITAAHFSGNGSNLTSITGANITGNVANAINLVTNGTISSSVTGVTQTTQDNSNKIATTAFVQSVLQTLYPIGSIYTNAVDNTNPSILFGFGIWVSFAAGRVLLAHGSGFFTGVTGGSANAVVVAHTHSAISNVTDPGHLHQSQYDGRTPNGIDYVGGGDEIAGLGRNYNYPTTSAVTGISVNTSILSTGTSGVNENLPPYIVVYMWRRTA